MHHILLNNLLILVATCLNSNQALLKLTCFVRKKNYHGHLQWLGYLYKTALLSEPKKYIVLFTSASHWLLTDTHKFD